VRVFPLCSPARSAFRLICASVKNLPALHSRRADRYLQGNRVPDLYTAAATMFSDLKL
jgi:hypothetical protein